MRDRRIYYNQQMFSQYQMYICVVLLILFAAIIVISQCKKEPKRFSCVTLQDTKLDQKAQQFQLLFDLCHQKFRYNRTPANLNVPLIKVKYQECTQYSVHGRSIVYPAGERPQLLDHQQWTDDDKTFIKNYNMVSFACQFHNPELDLKLQLCNDSTALQELIIGCLYTLFDKTPQPNNHNESPTVFVEL